MSKNTEKKAVNFMVDTFNFNKAMAILNYQRACDDLEPLGKSETFDFFVKFWQEQNQLPTN